MAIGKHLFLDLEDTIITPVVNGWFNTAVINVSRVKGIIEQFKPDSIHLFSFAIWNQAELRGFNVGTRPLVEKVFGFELATTPTVDDDIIPACCRVLNLSHERVDFSDASAFWGKHEAFRLFVRHKFATLWKNWGHEAEVLLLDDAVVNEEFNFTDLHIRGTIANIDNLPEPYRAFANTSDPGQDERRAFATRNHGGWG